MRSTGSTTVHSTSSRCPAAPRNISWCLCTREVRASCRRPRGPPRHLFAQACYTRFRTPSHRPHSSLHAHLILPWLPPRACPPVCEVLLHDAIPRVDAVHDSRSCCGCVTLAVPQAFDALILRFWRSVPFSPFCRHLSQLSTPPRNDGLVFADIKLHVEVVN